MLRKLSVLLLVLVLSQVNSFSATQTRVINIEKVAGLFNMYLYVSESHKDENGVPTSNLNCYLPGLSPCRFSNMPASYVAFDNEAQPTELINYAEQMVLSGVLSGTYNNNLYFEEDDIIIFRTIEWETTFDVSGEVSIDFDVIMTRVEND